METSYLTDYAFAKKFGDKILVFAPISYPDLAGKTCVEFTPQTLEEEQKAQARENIDAVSKSDLNNRLGGLKIIHNEDGSISITDGETEE